MSDLKCWMCESRGAVRGLANVRRGRKVWQAFKPEPQGNIRLDRDEHVCPACRGSANPHNVSFPLDRPAGRVAAPPGEGPAPAYDNSAGASGPPASRT